jgi:hypothetical protein
VETLVTSFFADVGGRDYYSRSAARLRTRLTGLEVPHDIVELPSQGSYRANCLAKPGFILDQLRKTAAPLVWLDVDSVVHGPLDIFDSFVAGGHDVGAATRSYDVNGLQSTPLYFAPTPGALQLLEDWSEAAQWLLTAEETATDHEALVWVFPAAAETLAVGWLGPEYCAWPGTSDAQTVIELGLTDEPTKEPMLRKMGHSEAMIAMEMPGFLGHDGD